MEDRILITGGTGLVGFQLKKLMPEAICIGSDIDLRDPIIVNELFSKLKPTKVIHCAAKVGGLGGNMNYKGDFFYDNIMMNTNVIEACRVYNVEKLVCFLSTCVFPDNVEYPLTEKKIHSGPPHTSNYSYAYAKRMVDIQLQSYREQYGLNYVSVIPTNIYGENDNFNLETGHVIPSLIHKCYLAKQKNEVFRIWGTGKPLREFIHSSDISKLTHWCLENYKESEPIILSNLNEVSIAYIAELIAEQFDYKDKIVFEADKPDGQFRKPSDNSKIKKYLPSFEFKPIEEGIKETVAWFVENHNKDIRK